MVGALAAWFRRASALTMGSACPQGSSDTTNAHKSSGTSILRDWLCNE